MVKHIVIGSCLLVQGITLLAQQNQGILNYINTYKDLAVDEMQRTGIPAAIKLAQGIHETDAGNSELVKKSNNHFGIKCKNSWTGPKVYHNDDARGECFRSYASAEESYRDHSNFLKGSERYAFLFKLQPEDYKGWAYGLREAGYATNIRYSQLLIKLIEDYQLQDYTLLALGKMIDKKELVTSPSPEFMPGSDTSEPVSATGIFEINKTKVLFIKAGTSLLSVATAYDIPLAKLIDFNDLVNDETPQKDQLLFLQRKRKTGANHYHIVQPGESLYDICQLEGIRMESLLQYNMLPAGVKVAVGEKIFLQGQAPVKPLLETEKNYATTAGYNKEITHVIHTVQPKESLYSIAKKYNVTVEAIREWNKLNTFDLKTGQQIIVKR
jgi:LysM repeat protein